MIRVLAGLPAYGPLPTSFPKANAFREGLVVEFSPNRGERWIGNFAEGWLGRPHCVHAAADGRSVVVAAGGAGYLVDIKERNLIRQFELQELWSLDGGRMFLMTNGRWFEAFDVHRVLWESRQISLDGMQNFELNDPQLRGEAYQPHTQEWIPFEINIRTGDAVGGSY